MKILVDKVAAFIGAAPDEIIFTKGATESLNRVAFEYGLSVLKTGDKIVIQTRSIIVI
jgi:cysteine desulfurase / selenocysteine lyase